MQPGCDSEALVWGMALTRESARRVRVRAPEVSFKNLQSSPALWPQTSLQDTLGDLKSLAIFIFKAPVIPAATQVQAPVKTSAACFIADALALP